MIHWVFFIVAERGICINNSGAIGFEDTARSLLQCFENNFGSSLRFDINQQSGTADNIRKVLGVVGAIYHIGDINHILAV